MCSYFQLFNLSSPGLKYLSTGRKIEILCEVTRHPSMVLTKIWVMKVFTGSSRINALGFYERPLGWFKVLWSDFLVIPTKVGLQIERDRETQSSRLWNNRWHWEEAPKNKGWLLCSFACLPSQLLTQVVQPQTDRNSFEWDLLAFQDWGLNKSSGMYVCICVCMCVRER